MAARVRTASTSDGVEDLEGGLIIDQHDLDTALIQQPDLFYRVAKRLALVTSRRDAAKQALAEEEARTDFDIRRDAAKKNTKPTESEVKNLIKVDKEVVKLNTELHQLNAELGLLAALKEAFSQRSYVLKDLVKLYIANYYENNSEGGGSTDRALKDHNADAAKKRLAAARRGRERDDRDDD